MGLGGRGAIAPRRPDVRAGPWDVPRGFGLLHRRLHVVGGLGRIDLRPRLQEVVLADGQRRQGTAVAASEDALAAVLAERNVVTYIDADLLDPRAKVLFQLEP